MPDTPIRTVLDGRPVWLVDGFVLPVISGGDDDGDLSDPGGLGEASSAFSAALDDAPAGDDGAGAPPPPPGADGAPTGDAGGEPRMVPWDEYVSLRRENATYRQRFQPYEQTFGSLDPEVSEALLGIAQKYGEDPEEAAALLLAAFGIDVPADEAPPTQLTEEALREAMRSEMESYFQQMTRQAEEQRTLAANRESIKSVAKSLGVEPDTKEYRRLLSLARDEFATDEFGDPVPAEQAIRAAHESIMAELSAYEQQVRASFIEGVGDRGGVKVVGAGEATSGEKEITTLEDSKRALRAWAETA